MTKNFTLSEFTASATAKAKNIDNTPNEATIANIKKLCETILQPIRDKYGFPIIVTSGYRCKALNDAVKGSKTSQHMTGAAADIKCTHTSRRHLFDLIKKMIDNKEIEVGQLIWEYGTKSEPNWIHVSLPYSKKNQILYFYS